MDQKFEEEYKCDRCGSVIGHIENGYLVIGNSFAKELQWFCSRCGSENIFTITGYQFGKSIRRMNELLQRFQKGNEGEKNDTSKG